MSRLYLFIILMLSLNGLSYAHKASDSYLYLDNQKQKLTARWDIALRDLEYVIGLDNDLNGEITWGEVKTRILDINAYALSRLKIVSDQQQCLANPRQHLISRHNQEGYLAIQLKFDCPSAVTTLTIEYQLLFDKDPLHRGLVRLDSAQDMAQTWVFGPSSRRQHLKINNPGSMRLLITYLREGVRHIWIGYDHILFLLTLLFPAVLVYRDRRWQPVDNFKPAFIEVVKIVTAFTLSHSVTLTLAVLNIISFQARWVEITIALSVLLSALNNLFPVFTDKRWLLAFGFGLIHGFGFANVLIELGLPNKALGLALFGFNLGVEIGQLAIVVVYFPLAYYFRKSLTYRWVMLRFGSILAAGMAIFWIIQRVFS